MKSILDTLQSENSCSTTVNALKKTVLAETLSGTGPFTLFVPDDNAFAKVNLEDVLNDTKQLTETLKYHVLEGKVMRGEMMTLEHAETMNIKPLTIRVKDGEILIDNGKVVRSDIECTNVVIHIVDAVSCRGSPAGTVIAVVAEVDG
jgi:uncharacterized surface protein with fasciclin (FAS1) repeats